MKITEEVLKKIDELFLQLKLPNALRPQVLEHLEKMDARILGADVAIATAIFLVCRRNAIPISLTLICNVTGVSRKKIHKMLKRNGGIVDTTAPEQYIFPLLDRLEINGRLREQMREEALKFIEKMNSMSFIPLVKAVAAVYLAGVKIGVSITQQKLEEVTGITSAAIRNVITELYGRRSEKSIRTIIKRQEQRFSGDYRGFITAYERWLRDV